MKILLWCSFMLAMFKEKTKEKENRESELRNNDGFKLFYIILRGNFLSVVE